MIDNNDYRANVGIALTNDKQQIFIAKRYKQDYWQLPQGGIDEKETALKALLRELREEIGLHPKQVKVIAKTPKWLSYEFPKWHIKHTQKTAYIGQKQIWFLLKLVSSENNIKLDTHKKIEFDNWQWTDYWRPIEKVVYFKKRVYKNMLKTFAPIVFNNQYVIPKKHNTSSKLSAIIL